MNFLTTCSRWYDIGQKYRDLFRSDHLVISGRDELKQLLDFYFDRMHSMVPSRITKLTITLAPTYQYIPGSQRNSFGYDCRLMDVMEQIQSDLTFLRMDLFQNFWIRREWTTRTLQHFSLYVSFSAVSSRRRLLKEWVRQCISREIEEEWRRIQWTGSAGFYGENFYSCWDR